MRSRYNNDMAKQRTKYKICPRCGLKMPESTPECADCGLKFERLALATNKDAKRKKLRGDRSFIINVKALPSDVSYWKLLLMTIFLGAVGGHCYYVGRYLKGAIYSANFLALVFFVIFNNFFLTLWGGVFFDIVMPICGFILIFWIMDIVAVGLKKFKIPVAIDLEGGEK